MLKRGATMLNSTFQIQNRTPAHRPPPLSAATVTVSKPKTRLPSYTNTTPAVLPEPKPTQSRARTLQALLEQEPDFIGPLAVFQEAAGQAVQFTEIVGATVIQRHKDRLDEYEAKKDREIAELETIERELAELEAVLRVRREKVRVKTAELNAVRNKAKKEEEDILAHTKKRAARLRAATEEIGEKRAYTQVYGKCFAAHLGIHYMETPGKCLCPEGKFVASIIPAEEECNFWDCPALAKFKVPARTSAPQLQVAQERQKSQSQPRRPPNLPRPPPPTATPSQHVRPVSEPETTTELFPQTPDPTAELFPHEPTKSINLNSTSKSNPE